MEDKLNEYLFNTLSDPEKKQLLDELDHDKALQQEFTDKLNTLSVVMMQEKKGDDAYAGYRLKDFRLKTRSIFLRKRAVQAVRYAAVILLTIGFFSIYQHYKRESHTDNYASIEVPNGQRVHIYLPDGTSVWLNAGSKLTYPSGFSAKNRNVILDGEAYFEVTSDKRNPFRVQTLLMDVNVLGTEFNVKSYTGEPSVVTLTEGKVELSSKNGAEKLLLNPNEQATVSGDAENIVLSKHIYNDIVNLWISGEYIYVNQPLKTIVYDLERQFNVRITILDEDLSKDLFTARFAENETITQVLSRLKGTRELDYMINGNDIQIIKQ